MVAAVEEARQQLKHGREDGVAPAARALQARLLLLLVLVLLLVLL